MAAAKPAAAAAAEEPEVGTPQWMDEQRRAIFPYLRSLKPVAEYVPMVMMLEGMHPNVQMVMIIKNIEALHKQAPDTLSMLIAEMDKCATTGDWDQPMMDKVAMRLARDAAKLFEARTKHPIPASSLENLLLVTTPAERKRGLLLFYAFVRYLTAKIHDQLAAALGIVDVDEEYSKGVVAADPPPQ